MLNYLKKRYLPFNFNMLMENIQKCIFFLIFHLAHFFCSRVYVWKEIEMLQICINYYLMQLNRYQVYMDAS